MEIRTVCNRKITHRNAHASGPGYEPAPNGRAAAAGIKGKGKSGHDGREQATNADGKRKGRQVPEFPLEDRIVAKLGGELGIRVAQVLDANGFALAIGAIDLNCDAAVARAEDAVMADGFNARAEVCHGGCRFVAGSESTLAKIDLGEGGVYEGTNGIRLA